MSVYIALTQLMLKLEFILTSSIFPVRGISFFDAASWTTLSLSITSVLSVQQFRIIPSWTSPELQNLEYTTSSQHLQRALSISW